MTKVYSPEEIMNAIVQAVERAAVETPGRAVPVEIPHGRGLDIMPLLMTLLEYDVCVVSLTANRRDFVLGLKKIPKPEMERLLNEESSRQETEWSSSDAE